MERGFFRRVFSAPGDCSEKNKKDPHGTEAAGAKGETCWGFRQVQSFPASSTLRFAISSSGTAASASFSVECKK